MTVYEVLKIVMTGVILITLMVNLIQVYKESKQLKAEGKTPLTIRNLNVIMCAAIAEFLVAYLLLALFNKLHAFTTSLNVFLIFIVVYLLRNAGAYLTAWGLWSIFVKIDQKKLRKELIEEREEALK